MNKSIARFLIGVLTASIVFGPAAAYDLPPKTMMLIPADKTTMSISGKVRLLQSAGNQIFTVTFENGASLKVTGGDDGVYRINPPRNPLLLHNHRLCGGFSATWMAYTGGIHNAVSVAFYHGAQMTDKTLCASFEYTSSG
jgi:hypothetical protein